MNATVSAAIAARLAKGQTEEQTRQGVVNSLISVATLTRLADGQSMEKAMDAVLGKGQYANLAGEVYDALRDKQGLK